MADKLTALPTVTTLADGDLVYAVDVSDTTDDPAGSSVAITKANLLTSGAPTASVGASKVLLQEIDLTTAGGFDFTDIPAGYDRLIIQGYVRSTGAGGSDGVVVFLNEDTTPANYGRQEWYAAGATNTASRGDDSRIAYAPAATALTEQVGDFRMEIGSYADASIVKTVRGTCSYGYGVDLEAFTDHTVVSAITAPITRVRLQSDGDTLTGKLRLFGERSVSIVDAPTVTTKIQVATITDPVSGKFSFDLTDYQDGDRVVLEGSLRNTVAGTAAVMYINGDTTATNYKAQLTRSGDGTMLAQEFDAARILYITESTSPTGAYAQAKITLEDYAGPYKKTARGEFAVHQSTDTMWSGTYGWYSKLITAPVTSILIESVAGSDILEGSLTCYIEKQGVIAATGGGTPGDPVTFTKKELIAETTDPDGSGFDFTVPAGYDRLMIVGSIAGTNAATNEIVKMYFNGDTTDTNYFFNQFAHYDAVETNSDGATPTAGVIAGANSVGESSFYAYIENPGAGPVKNAQVQSARYSTLGTQAVSTKSDVYHDSMTAALASISIVGNSGSAIAGTLSLYGEKEETFYPANVVETASFDLPVVQSARFDAGTAVEWSSEPGWTITKNAVGKYTVTFPTAAVSATEQSLVATVNGAAVDSTIWSTVNNITTTSCDVAVSYQNTLFTDLPFSLVRRLPDTSVANKVIVPSRVGEVVKEEIARITDPGTGGYVFSIPAGYDRLRINGQVSSAGGTEIDTLYAYLNGDETAANYTSLLSRANGTTDTFTAFSDLAAPRCGYATGASKPAGYKASLDYLLEAPDSTDTTKTLRCTFSVPDNVQESYEGVQHATWDTYTSAVTSVKVVSSGANALTGTLILYGERTL